MWEGQGRGGAPAAGRGDSNMHACVVMQWLYPGRQVSPGGPVEFESGLSPPPIEAARTASHAPRSRFGGRSVPVGKM